jgi:integrase
MVQCKNVSTTKTYLDYIPSREDVQRLLDAAKLHHKVAIGLLAFSGLRPVDVCNLKYKHIKASYEKGEDVLTIVLKHRKTRQWYVSFVGTQCTRYIRSYLEARQERGEKITDESPIVRWHGGGLRSVSLRIAVMRIIENTVGRHPTGEEFRKFRPYGLRKYFRRTLNKIGESEAEYLMGHSKGLESLTATYGGLRDMDPKAIAELRKRYISVLPELETEVSDTTLKAQLEEKEREKKRLAESLGGIREELDELREFMEMLKD